MMDLSRFKNYQQVKCKYCKYPYYKKVKKTNHTIRIRDSKIRGVNTVTCSRKCSISLHHSQKKRNK